MEDIRASNREIIEYIQGLSSSFGIRRDLPPTTLFKIKKAYEARLFSECVREVKSFLGLNLTILLCLVKNRPTCSGMLKFLRENAPRIGCAPDNLVLEKTEELGTLENTSAFVLQPEEMPLYGTREFEKLKIMLLIFKRTTEQPFETFAYCIAHELSHIVLSSIRHPLRDNEVAVDLTAMILGFSDIVMAGRRTSERHFGYLSDEQFCLAYDEIKRRSKIIYL